MSAPVESRFDELKRYVRLSADDARILAGFRALAAPHFERITQEFYERIREHEEAHAVFTGEAQIARLQRSLVRWMDRLLSGSYNDAYYEETAKIGRVHVRVGLPQRYMFTAMALIRVALTRIADQEDPAGAPAIREALTRLIDLELAIMLETYRENVVARLRRKDELENQALTRSLARSVRYVNAVELARVVIVGVDRAGAIRLFNREAESVSGFERDEVLGAPFAATLLPEEMLEAHGARVNDVAAGHTTSLEIADGLIRTRAHNVRDVHWHLAFAPGAGDDIVLFAMGKDTTDERRALNRARQHERLAAVGTLAAGLAHEIRNPLNGAQLHVLFLERSLKREKADPELLEAVDVVGDEIKRLARLVTEFLDFARPSPLVLARLSIHELGKRVSVLLEQEATQSGVTLKMDLPLQEISVVGDASKLEQVLLNVLQNAIEAAKTSGGSVTLRVRRKPRHVMIDVEDNGPGIGALDAPIYDAFYSTKLNGTGLGLSIVHRIVTDHRGTIDVESRPGRTCFRITLPLEAPDVPSVRPKAAREAQDPKREP